MLTEPSKPEPGYFTEADSAEVVISRNANGRDRRLKQVMEVIVRKLHEAVKEIEPTNAEWMMAIEFLTKTGQMCNEWRQEWILLSDILGVSMLVDAINNRKPSGATETTVLGPFYVSDAPRYPLGANICLDGKGEPLLVTGKVTDTEGRPIAGALLDIWQSNEDGFYDVQQKGVQPEMNLRGVFTTDANGRFWFRSAKAPVLPDSERRAGRPALGVARPSSLSARSYPFYRRRGWLSPHHDPYFRAGFSVFAHGRGFRRESKIWSPISARSMIPSGRRSLVSPIRS